MSVDTELLLLVDVTKSVTPADFLTMMSDYADAFESSDVIMGLQTGQVGSIAAAMVFYGDKNDQVVGVNWLEISNATEAGAFADILRTTPRPFDKNKTSIANALDFSVPLFGDETGGAANGFESTTQVIQVTGDGIDNNSKKTGGNRETTVAAARDAALSSGVDVINALTVGAAGSVDDYFAAYVVGGGVNGQPAVVTNAETFANFDVAVAMQVQASVPEPSVTMALMVGLLGLGFHRRRVHVR